MLFFLNICVLQPPTLEFRRKSFKLAAALCIKPSCFILCHFLRHKADSLNCFTVFRKYARFKLIKGFFSAGQSVVSSFIFFLALVSVLWEFCAFKLLITFLVCDQFLSVSSLFYLQLFGVYRLLLNGEVLGAIIVRAIIFTIENSKRFTI